MDTCVSTAEYLCCSPETTTTLLTGYTPIQNTKFHVKKKKFTFYVLTFYRKLLIAVSNIISTGTGRQGRGRSAILQKFFILYKKHETY